MQDIPFNTSHYEEEHGQAPHHLKVGDWKFLPPKTFGRRPWLYIGLSYTEARQMAREKIGNRPVGDGEEFILCP